MFLLFYGAKLQPLVGLMVCFSLFGNHTVRLGKKTQLISKWQILHQPTIGDN